ncbi:MAG TPA: hypothetical protein VGM44_12545 [Polyangiaceae bacterium]
MTRIGARVLASCSLVLACSSGGSGGASSTTNGGSSTNAGTSSTSGGTSSNAGSSAAQGGGVAQGGSAGTSSAQAGSPSAGSGGTSDSNGGPTVAEFVGLNAFIDDDLDKLAAIGNVREYHDWTWNDGNGAQGYPGYPNNALEFSLFNGFWDFDAYYSGLKTRNVIAFPCVEGSVDYLNSAMPPVASGADATDPASYVAHASFMYQYAARYGSTMVDASKLKLDAGQTVVSGMNVLRYYEDGNEPDATWVHTDGSFLFTPEMTAAMASADYDGNQGKLGDGFGVKAADPSAKLVLAGLAGAGTKDYASNVEAYLDGMRAWATAHRAGSFPADVINIHDYCFGPDPFGTANPKPGLSPEDCKLQALMASIVSYRDQNLAGKELWLTEFGYDTNAESRLRAPAIGGNSAEVVQGQWLVRSFIALMAAGLDRAFVFVSRDDCTGDDTKCPNNAVQFSTSGVMTEKGSETPKTAFYFLAAFRARLGAMRYQGSADSGSANVSIAKFYDSTADQGAFVVWAPTSTAQVVKGYALAVSASLATATLVTLADQTQTGNETPLTATQGSVMLDVSETPSIVLVKGKP